MKLIQVRQFLLWVAAMVATVSSTQMDCFKPGSSISRPTAFNKCSIAVEKMAPDMRLARKPIRFSRNHDEGLKVPLDWRHGNCVILLDVLSDTDSDTATLFGLAIQANVLNNLCVIKEPHLGGSIILGKDRLLNLTILGASSARAAIDTS
ncbi:MAG: hypothetical protein Q9212_001818 [Teloschistes hypoglaucus]